MHELLSENSRVYIFEGIKTKIRDATERMKFEMFSLDAKLLFLCLFDQKATWTVSFISHTKSSYTRHWAKWFVNRRFAKRGMSWFNICTNLYCISCVLTSHDIFFLSNYLISYLNAGQKSTWEENKRWLSPCKPWLDRAGYIYLVGLKTFSKLSAAQTGHLKGRVLMIDFCLANTYLQHVQHAADIRLEDSL